MAWQLAGHRMLDSIINSYLYTQYNDDDDLRAFVTAYNSMAQQIYTWMTSANLPIFAGGYQAGDQLRWIAYCIYGVKPPVQTSGKRQIYGPSNTFTFNRLPFNTRKVVAKSDQIVVSDDLFKRIMTWNFYKGDGFYFTNPWLKRRIMRFLTGVDGTDIPNDQHWIVSVVFSDAGMVITITKRYTQLTDAALYNDMECNDRQYDQNDGVLIKSNGYEYADLFKQAFDSGLLHIPFYLNGEAVIIG